MSASEFSTPIINLGIVVKDIDRTARFLTNALGLKEAKGFTVPAEFGKKNGLIDGHTTTIRMFVLEEVEPGTRIKVPLLPKAPGRQPDQTTIHATRGFRCLTLYVKDMNRALERLKQVKVALLDETLVELGGGTRLVACKDPNGNSVELTGLEH